jgi:hypothetical protein
VLGQLQHGVLIGLPNGLAGDLRVQAERHEIGDGERQDARRFVVDRALAEVGDLSRTASVASTSIAPLAGLTVSVRVSAW